jgi:hypothetical protein
MTQPSFVPITEADQVRPARRLQVPGPWHADRPAELIGPQPPFGRGRGTPGPDQGYALRLARRFEERLVLTEGEHAADVLVGAALLAATRSALFGRAPTIYDLRVAFELFGFLGPAPPPLVEMRRRRFSGAAEHYPAQRALVDGVPMDTLRLDPDEVAARRGQWAQLLGPPAGDGEPGH